MANVTDVVADSVKSLKLELNKEEIQFLCDVFNNIAGSPVASRRRISYAIRDAMRDAGVDVDPKGPSDLRGNIHFLDTDITKTVKKSKGIYNGMNRYDYDEVTPF